MQKSEGSVSFSQKTTKSVKKVPLHMCNKQNALKQKVRYEISQVFH